MCDWTTVRVVNGRGLTPEVEREIPRVPLGNPERCAASQMLDVNVPFDSGRFISLAIIPSPFRGDCSIDVNQFGGTAEYNFVESLVGRMGTRTGCRRVIVVFLKRNFRLENERVNLGVSGLRRLVPPHPDLLPWGEGELCRVFRTPRVF